MIAIIADDILIRLCAFNFETRRDFVKVSLIVVVSPPDSAAVSLITFARRSRDPSYRSHIAISSWRVHYPRKCPDACGAARVIPPSLLLLLLSEGRREGSVWLWRVRAASSRRPVRGDGMRERNWGTAVSQQWNSIRMSADETSRAHATRYARARPRPQTLV